jgi:hypothetical protein
MVRAMQARIGAVLIGAVVALGVDGRAVRAEGA